MTADFERCPFVRSYLELLSEAKQYLSSASLSTRIFVVTPAPVLQVLAFTTYLTSRRTSS